MVLQFSQTGPGSTMKQPGKFFFLIQPNASIIIIIMESYEGRQNDNEIIFREETEYSARVR